ncbi:MAG: Carboxypeptidase-like regulatory protein [Bacteroidota bacterium]|nr:Carboxypeptidase-like regulatory protein [Bacteroidota bacterium]
MRKFVTSILFLFVSLLSFGQFELKGIVIDAKTKEPLPYVNFYVGSGVGGTTDDSGRFEFTVNARTDSVIFSYVGYKDEILKKRFFRRDSIVVKLHLESFMLEEFTVKAKKGKIPKDTIAIRIFRSVVRHKDENKPKSYDSYQYEEYQKTVASIYNISPKIAKRKILKPFRFILENQDTSASGARFVPLILKETLSDYYFNKDPKKNKTVVKASKVSGIEQLRFSELLDVAFDDIEAYDNQAVLYGKTFLLPFADGGLALYNYYLIDSVKGADSAWIYNLAFVPKSKSDLLFNGRASIHDSSFAIMNIVLSVDSRANINFVNELEVKQGFVNTPKGWFKNKESRTTNLPFIRRKKSKSIRLSRYLDRKDIIIDRPIADTILKQENTVYVKDYRNHPDTFWLHNRHDTLSTQEGKVYILIDSLKNTMFYKVISKVGGILASGYYKTHTLNYGNLYQLVSWNDLEGVRLRLNLQSNWHLSEWVSFKVYGAYGIKDKRFKYGGEISSKLPDKHHYHSITAAYKDDYQRFSLNGNQMDFDFIYSSLFRNKSISDLVYLKDVKLSYFREWKENLSTEVSFNYRIYKTIPGRIEFVKTISHGTDFESGGLPVIERDTINKFHIFAPNFNITWTPGAKFLQTSTKKSFLKGKLPRINFNYSFSVKGKTSDFSFNKLDLLIEERFPSPIGHTIIQLSGMKLFGSAPYPLLTIHPGNQSFLNDFQRFTNMRETEFIADQQLTLFIEHHFDGFFFNKIPGWKRLALREVFITKMAVSSINTKNVSFSDLPKGLYGLNGFYAEIGFGIENIVRFMRVDFTWRLTQLNNPGISKFRWTMSFAPNF